MRRLAHPSPDGPAGPRPKSVDLPDYIMQNLCTDALKALQQEYDNLTLWLHSAAEKLVTGDDASALMALGKNATAVGERLVEIGKTISWLSDAGINELPIDPTLLGPKLSNGIKVYTVDDGVHPDSTIVGFSTGIEIRVGKRDEEYNYQPFVTVNTEGCPSHLHDEEGVPKLTVDLNDATLHDRGD